MGGGCLELIEIKYYYYWILVWTNVHYKD